jgi:hypothetical protein
MKRGTTLRDDGPLWSDSESPEHGPIGVRDQSSVVSGMKRAFWRRERPHTIFRRLAHPGGGMSPTQHPITGRR